MLTLFGILPSPYWRAATLAGGVIIAACGTVSATDEALSNGPPQPRWGRIITETNGTETVTIEVDSRPGDGKLTLPPAFPNITAAHLVKGVEREPLTWIIETNGSRFFQQISVESLKRLPAIIEIESGEKTEQLTGGRIVFSGRDAQTTTAHGASAPLRLAPSDRASWAFKPTRWGMYDIELSYSSKATAELRLDAAGHTFSVTAPSTGSLFHYTTVPVGRFYLAKAEPFTLSVDCKTLKAGAMLELNSATFRPAPEGSPIIEDATDITLRASNAITHSVTMRYEPATNKNCLGYWVNPHDWAEWEFTVTHPGVFEIEIWQGCGKGNGGSDVQVESGGRKFVFQVVDTGDYHKLTSLRVGRVEFPAPGRYSLAVRPLQKKAGAIMDIQQVKLIPINSP